MPMVRSLYPRDWSAISLRIRARDGNVCACRGECGAAHPGGQCRVPNGARVLRSSGSPWLWQLVAGDEGVLIVLTVAHLDHDPMHNDDENLRAMCQRCHLCLDAAQHARNGQRTRHRRRALGDLFQGTYDGADVDKRR